MDLRIAVGPPVVALAILSILGVLAGCGEEGGCDLDTYTRDQGGFGLVDCGIAGEDTSAVDACAVMALRQGSTFRALYETDDGGLQAIVRTHDDVYLQVRTDADGAALEQSECGDGVLSQESGRSYVACIDPEEPIVVCD